MRLSHISSDQKRWLLVGAVIVLALICIVQLLYPRDRLVPFATIDSVRVGGWTQKDAVWELDHRIAEQPISITIEKTDRTYRVAKPAEIGLTVNNQARVAAASYPLWARMIPTSLLWNQLLYPHPSPQYTRSEAKLADFVRTALGDCRLAPQDASVTFRDDALQVVPASSGGVCDKNDVISKLLQASPTVTRPAAVAVDVAIQEPKVTDEVARAMIRKVTARTKDGIALQVGKDTKTITQRDILSWLTFKSNARQLTVGIDEKLSDAYFAKNITPLVAVPAGTTMVTTRDFTELSRKTGKSGRTLDASATRSSLLAVVEGPKTVAVAAVKPVDPNVTYSRSYTKTSTGIAALLAHYDQDNPGTFGVSFTELGGQKRSAAFGQDRLFTTASTYKLFVAFSVLKYVDSGTYKWSDKIVDTRDLNTCFDDMIVKSDNPCAEALLEKVGRKKLDEDLRSIGLTRSTFRAKSNQTTAAELAQFLAKLENNELPIKSPSRDRLLGAMKRQVYRQGVPAGTSAAVADKVGFLEGLLHDAAIVYSPQGTYVLVILSDKSSWANIAELTSKIESLR